MRGPSADAPASPFLRAARTPDPCRLPFARPARERNRAPLMRHRIPRRRLSDVKAGEARPPVAAGERGPNRSRDETGRLFEAQPERLGDRGVRDLAARNVQTLEKRRILAQRTLPALV